MSSDPVDDARELNPATAAVKASIESAGATPGYTVKLERAVIMSELPIRMLFVDSLDRIWAVDRDERMMTLLGKIG